ncbi:RAMP superfamily CRISPR-associated protein [Metasolibacillus meyeri]|uniref:RAMP superfamily CRISPR-associated protein n=1 Tax=Metasolibacillus meyeri TaxID=1071052 RepID=UPI000D308E22|nr:RAMP superfamily CRISPR-associated protein [Metasolibacillus meyeri]
MRQYELFITLTSDLSPGSGDSVAGLIDHEITHEQGFPVIPAKRLKGALRHMAKELVDWGYTENDKVDILFGKIGEGGSGGFKIYDATLYQIPEWYFKEKVEPIENMDALKQGLHDKNSGEILALWTMVHTKTAIDHNSGQAKTGSLRSMRVINRGLTFKSSITLDNEGDYEFLEACVKALRHLGYGRTRGLGEVTCTLSPVNITDKEVGVENSPSSTTTEMEQPFRITLQQPVLLAGNEGLYDSCANFISGSTLLGVFASLYIQARKLENEAHRDEEFARLFLRGGISFGYAYPEINGQVFTPCPLHIQREKHGSAAYREGFSDPPLVRKINQLAFIDGEKLLLHEPKKEMRMHHARPDDRRIGRALNDAKEAEGKGVDGNKGQFYYYTALSRGQSFVGTLRGNASDIALLMALLAKRGNKIQLGRSRTAEYGEATLLPLCKLSKEDKAVKNDKKVAIYCETPLALQDKTGRYVADPQLFISQIESTLGVAITIEKTFLKQTILKGYNAKWRLPKQEKVAFDAGTVLLVSAEKDVDWQTVEKTLWGSDTAHGCGKVRVLSDKHLPQKFTVENKHWQPVQDVAQSDEKLLSLIQKELCTRQQKELDKKEARGAAKEFAKDPAIKAIGQTKIYQLAEHFLKKAQYEEERFTKKENVKSIYEKLNIELPEKSEDFLKAFFHTLKLEVRADDNK